LPNGSLKKSDVPDDTQSSRPPYGKLRRRSTLNWTNAPPSVRQKRLENVTTGRMADTWFSLHCAHISEPLYISEVVEKAMNPSFRFFDLLMYGPLVTRSDKLTIKYWAKTEIMEEYKLLIEMHLNLGSLQFIGKTVRK
jgi:UV radiation resistance-associated gene protein